MGGRAMTGLLLAGAVLACLGTVPRPGRCLASPPEQAGGAASGAGSRQADAGGAAPSRLLERLELPGPFSARASAAVLDPQAFERVLRSYFLTRPRLEGLPGASSRTALEEYRQGVLRLSPNPPVPFTLPLDWAAAGPGRNFLSQLHSLRFLPPLMQAYRETGDEQLLGVVEEVWLDWARKNPFTGPRHPQAWNEGSVARRVRVLLHLLNLYKDTGGPRAASLTLLLASLCQHADFLAGGRYYEVGSNHGLRQDWGLLAVSLGVPEFRGARRWTELALTRMRVQQVGISFSSEGVHLEHSPGYHLYEVRMINQIASLLRENGFQGDLSWIEALNRRSNRYLTHVLTPAGSFPPVGDSSESRPDRALARGEPALLYAATSGAAGTPPAELDGFFPDAGQVIFRDTWGAGPGEASRAIYVHMHAANHLAACPGHRHADELSFVLHGGGRWWVLEAGKYAYERDRWRAFVRSARAHNGYTFDGGALPWNRRTGREKDVYFEAGMVSTPGIAAARAHTRRFAAPGARATRTFVLLRARKTLVLLDRLSSPAAGKWEGYLHLAPDITVEVDGPAARARAPGPADVELEIVTETGGTRGVACVQGREEPPLGWHSPAYRKLVPSPTLVFDRTGRDVTAVTLLRFTAAGEPAARGLTVRRTNGTCTVAWREGEEEVVLVVEDEAPLRVRLGPDPGGSPAPAPGAR